MDFNISKDTVGDEIIGKFIFQNKGIVDVKETFFGNVEIVESIIGVWDILALDKNRVLCSNLNNKSLTLYDGNLNLVKKIDTINGENFEPRGLACNGNHLYIVDKQNSRIIMTDFEFRKIKLIGSKGNEFDNDKFNDPCGICFINESLYICDYSNARIQIYSKNLEFKKSFLVDFMPWVIKASNSLLFVQPGSITSLFIYELNSLNLKERIDNPAVFCRLSVINSNIYRFNSKSKSVLFYDENGKFQEEIILSNVDDNILSGTGDGTFIEFNFSLLMTSYKTKQLIRFSRK